MLPRRRWQSKSYTKVLVVIVLLFGFSACVCAQAPPASADNAGKIGSLNDQAVALRQQARTAIQTGNKAQALHLYRRADQLTVQANRLWLGIPAAKKPAAKAPPHHPAAPPPPKQPVVRNNAATHRRPANRPPAIRPTPATHAASPPTSRPVAKPAQPKPHPAAAVAQKTPVQARPTPPPVAPPVQEPQPSAPATPSRHHITQAPSSTPMVVAGIVLCAALVGWAFFAWRSRQEPTAIGPQASAPSAVSHVPPALQADPAAVGGASTVQVPDAPAPDAPVPPAAVAPAPVAPGSDAPAAAVAPAADALTPVEPDTIPTPDLPAPAADAPVSAAVEPVAPAAIQASAPADDLVPAAEADVSPTPDVIPVVTAVAHPDPPVDTHRAANEPSLTGDWQQDLDLLWNELTRDRQGPSAPPGKPQVRALTDAEWQRIGRIRGMIGPAWSTVPQPTEDMGYWLDAENCRALDYALYVAPFDDTAEADVLTGALGMLRHDMEQVIQTGQRARIAQLQSWGIERIVGSAGFKPITREVEPSGVYEATPFRNLHNTFCRVEPGEGGYRLSTNNTVLCRTRAVLYKFETPSVVGAAPAKSAGRRVS